MIDIFFRRAPTEELMHPRVVVTTAPDAERAQELIAALCDHGVAAAGRPSRRRGTVQQLVVRRDAALEREISRARALERRAALHLAKG